MEMDLPLDHFFIIQHLTLISFVCGMKLDITRDNLHLGQIQDIPKKTEVWLLQQIGLVTN
ncbi:hypothetical protein EA848_24725 [Vibrio anguillarum]|nr:hypothetical protein [Vibrio anguillarum]